MFNRLVGLLWLLFFGLTASAADYTVSRDQLVLGDPLRNWLHIWHPNGQAAGTVTLVNKAGQVFPTTHADPLARAAVRIEEQIYRNTCMVPSVTPADVYRVKIGSVDTGCDVTVSMATPRRVSIIYPSANAADNAAMIEAHAGLRSEVQLAPGLWRLARRVNIPAGSSLNGHGVTFQWTWPDRWSGTILHQNGLLWGDNCTFTGITFDLRGSGYLSWNGQGQGSVFDGCTFRDGQIGNWNQLNSLCIGCRFDRAGVGHAAGGTWIDCQFDGLAGGHAFLAEQGHRLCLLHCAFRNTDRGVILKSGWGPQHRTYVGWLTTSGQSYVDNGNETPMIREGGGEMTECIFYGLRSYANEGSLSLWEGNVKRCRFIDGVLDGPSFHFAASAPGDDQSDNIVERFEIRGGSLTFGVNAKRNKCVNVALVNPRPTRSNQFSHDHKPYDLSKLVGIAAARPAGYDPNTDPNANTCQNCTVIGLPQGKDFVNMKR